MPRLFHTNALTAVEEDLFFFGTNRITICLRDVLSAHAGPFNLSGFFTLPVVGIGFPHDRIRSC